MSGANTALIKEISDTKKELERLREKRDRLRSDTARANKKQHELDRETDDKMEARLGEYYYREASHKKTMADNNNRRLLSPITAEEITEKLYLGFLERLQDMKYSDSRWMEALEKPHKYVPKNNTKAIAANETIPPSEYFAGVKKECSATAERKEKREERENDDRNKKENDDHERFKKEHAREIKRSEKDLIVTRRHGEKRGAKAKKEKEKAKKRRQTETNRTYKVKEVRDREKIKNELERVAERMGELEVMLDETQNEYDCLDEEDERLNSVGVDDQDPAALEESRTTTEYFEDSNNRLRKLKRTQTIGRRMLKKLSRELSDLDSPQTIIDVKFHTRLSEERKRELKAELREPTSDDQKNAAMEKLANEDKLQEGFKDSLGKAKAEARDHIARLVEERTGVLEDWKESTKKRAGVKMKMKEVDRDTNRLDSSTNAIKYQLERYYELLDKRELQEEIPAIQHRRLVSENALFGASQLMLCCDTEEEQLEAFGRIKVLKKEDEQVWFQAFILDEAISKKGKHTPQTEKGAADLKRRQAAEKVNGKTPRKRVNPPKSEEEQKDFDRRSSNRYKNGAIQRKSQAKKKSDEEKKNFDRRSSNRYKNGAIQRKSRAKKKSDKDPE